MFPTRYSDTSEVATAKKKYNIFLKLPFLILDNKIPPLLVVPKRRYINRSVNPYIGQNGRVRKPLSYQDPYANLNNMLSKIQPKKEKIKVDSKLAYKRPALSIIKNCSKVLFYLFLDKQVFIHYNNYNDSYIILYKREIL